MINQENAVLIFKILVKEQKSNAKQAARSKHIPVRTDSIDRD